MRGSFQRVAYFILFGYLIISFFSGFVIVRKRIWKEEIQEEKYRKLTGLLD